MENEALIDTKIAVYSLTFLCREIFIYVRFPLFSHRVSASHHDNMSIITMVTIGMYVHKLSSFIRATKLVIRPLIICLRYTLSELMLHDAFCGEQIVSAGRRNQHNHKPQNWLGPSAGPRMSQGIQTSRRSCQPNHLQPFSITGPRKYDRFDSPQNVISGHSQM
jgi:hypothetical protein